MTIVETAVPPPSHPALKAAQRGRFNILGTVVVVVVVLLWQLIVGTRLINFEYLPAPSAVVRALLQVIANGELPAAVGHTVLVAFVSCALAGVIGVLVGVLVVRVRALGILTMSSIDFLRSIPAVAIMPVALLLLGPALETEILVAGFAALWPILINTMSGVQGITPRLLETARVLQLSGSETLRKIVIPATVPAVLVGVRLGIVTALVVAIIAEILVNPVGMGWQLVAAEQSLRPDVLFAYALVTGLLGFLLNVALVRAARLVMPGSPALRNPS